MLRTLERQPVQLRRGLGLALQRRLFGSGAPARRASVRRGGRASQKARALTLSLAGLAPMTRQSGRWKGKAFITGGRARLRQALEMPALVATRFNPDLKAKYDALGQAGKPAKIAITAIMRKLIELANALIRDDRLWAKTPA